MANGGMVRLGGVAGLLSVLFMLPAYVVGYPDAPTSPAEANTYFDEGLGAFVFANGTIPIFHLFFFLCFLVVLCGMLRRAEGEEFDGLSSAVLAGGIVFAALSAAGFAAEILYPATLLRFDGFQPDGKHVLLSLALSSWLYHFCQAGASVMVMATSLVTLRTGILRRWLGLLGLVIALLTLLHVAMPLLGALSGLLWIALVSTLMLAAGGRQTRTRRTRPAVR